MKYYSIFLFCTRLFCSPIAVLVPDLLIAFEIVWFVLILMGNAGGMIRSLFKQDGLVPGWVTFSGREGGYCCQDLTFDVLESFVLFVCFFLRVRRFPSRSDLLINWCCLLGHRNGALVLLPLCVVRIVVLCCAGLIHVQLQHFTFVSLL